MESRTPRVPVVSGTVASRMTGRIAIVAVAFMLCLATARVSVAQSTSSMIHGQAPAGDVVVVKSTTGFRHHATVKSNGKYVLRSLPLGIYSVTLMKGDKIIDKYHRVPLMVSRGMEVNFACPHDKCAAAVEDGS